jgi:hypothetical protein
LPHKPIRVPCDSRLGNTQLDRDAIGQRYASKRL